MRGAARLGGRESVERQDRSRHADSRQL